MSQRIDPPRRPGESLGALLTRLRQAQGKSQVRLAGLLCAASGQPTLTRHEVSRWEREERIPSRIWLGWLALVLDTPLDDLERAAAQTRRRREPTMTTTLTSTPTSTRTGTRTGARADPPIRAVSRTLTAATTAPPGGRGGPAPTGDDRPDRRGRIAELRRMDDLVAGPELLALVVAELRAAARDTAAGRDTSAGRDAVPGRDTPAGRETAADCGPAAERGAAGHGAAAGHGDMAGRRDIAGRGDIAEVAELAQLHAWVAADAGREPPDGVWRAGVRAAFAAGDRALAGHLLSCLAQTVAERGDGRAALRVAAAAERVAAGSDAATMTVLSLRVAFAAAQAGDQRACDTALTAAEHAYTRRLPGLDPPWLYWLDGAHVNALTGLCLAASGRPASALPRLAAALRAPTVRFRAAGLVFAATAQAHLATGDLDAACAAATDTLLTCVESGSFRVLHRLRRIEPALRAAAGPGHPPAALRAYTALAESTAAYLPGADPRAGRPASAQAGPARLPRREAS